MAGMESDRPLLSPALVVVVLSVLLLAAYVGGYLLRGRVGTVARVGAGPARVRTYPTRIEAELFGPFAFVESLLVGRDVYVGHSP